MTLPALVMELPKLIRIVPPSSLMIIPPMSMRMVPPELMVIVPKFVNVVGSIIASSISREPLI